MASQVNRFLRATNPLVVAILLAGSPLFAQGTIRTTTPGSAFSPEKAGEAAVEDIAGGRRFRGKAFADIILKGTIQIPPATSAEPKPQKLIIHFYTRNGPSLRSIELRAGTNPFRAEINITGDYRTVERLQGNAWAFSPMNGAPLVARLSIRFPGGFEGNSDPGDFVLTGVVAEFPRKPIATSSTTTTAERGARLGVPNAPPGRGSPPPVLAVPEDQVIYTLTSANELQWYAHSGRADGTFNWAAAQAKTVGSGWAFRQVFSGGDGVIYAITTAGDLLWYRHDGRADGSFKWAFADGKKVNTGWNFTRVFSGGGGVIYALTQAGDLLWFRHDGRADGSDRWTKRQGALVYGQWPYRQMFSGGDGVIYAVTPDKQLLWFRHEGRADGGAEWADTDGKSVGSGWDFKQIFSAGNGVIYAINASNQLLWYRHDGYLDGSVRWAANQGKQVGIGWSVKDIFSGAGF